MQSYLPTISMKLSKICLTGCLLFFSFTTYAQFGKLKEKLKNKTEDVKKETANNLEEKGKNTLANTLEKSRASYDSTNFSFAIALSDNAGFYEEKSLGKELLTNPLLTGLLKDGTAGSNDPVQNAKSNNELGEMMYSSRFYNKAERSFMKAQSGFESSNATNDIYYPKVISNLGLLYLSTGRYEKADDYIQRSIEVKGKLLGKNNLDYAASLNNLAVYKNQTGEYNEAEKLIEEAIKITEGLNKSDKGPLAVMYNNKGFFLQTVGRYADAEKFYQKCLAIADAEFKEKRPNYQKFLINLALLYQEMGKLDQAEQMYKECIAIKEKRGQKKHPDYAHLLDLTASLYMQMGKTAQVEEYLNKALDIYKNEFGEEHPAYATTMNHLGRFHRSQGNLSKAKPLLEESLATRAKVLGSNHPDYVEAQEDMAIYHWQNNEYQAAAKLYREVLQKTNDFVVKYFPPMSEAEKEKYWAKLRPTYLRFYSFATQFHTQDETLLAEMYNYHIATKGILLNSTNRIKQQILNSGNTSLIDQYNTWIDKKEYLARLYTLSKEELAEQGIDIEAQEREANSLEKKLSAQSTVFKQGFEEKPVKYENIATLLAADEAALEIIAFPKFDKVFTEEVDYVALVASKQSTTPKMALLTTGKSLESDDFFYYRNMIKKKQPNKFSYKAYWEKIDPLLTGKKKVYLSLDGVYNQINLNTLLKPDGKYLLEDHQFVLLTNTKDVLAVKAKGNLNIKNKSAFLLGFPNYGSSGKIGALPGTKKEVENIGGLLKGAGYQVTTVKGDNASESRVKAMRTNGILHIATHGFFLSDVSNARTKVFGIDAVKAQENPLLRAGLMLAGAEAAATGLENNLSLASKENGVWTAYEIMNQNLEGTELAVMSACETGLGDVKAGEGVYGLQRAFQVAGVDALVMSLWRVSDEATQALMTQFYKNILTATSKEEAFRKAQVMLKEKYPDPYFWGAFVLVGY